MNTSFLQRSSVVRSAKVLRSGPRIHDGHVGYDMEQMIQGIAPASSQAETRLRGPLKASAPVA